MTYKSDSYALVCAKILFESERKFQLFVDGAVHALEQGGAGFEEREPGCLTAFYNAFEQVIKYRGKEKQLSVDIILKLHRLVTKKVSHLNQGHKTKRGEFRDGYPAYLSLVPELFTIAGYQEAQSIYISLFYYNTLHL